MKSGYRIFFSLCLNIHIFLDLKAALRTATLYQWNRDKNTSPKILYQLVDIYFVCRSVGMILILIDNVSFRQIFVWFRLIVAVSCIPTLDQDTFINVGHSYFICNKAVSTSLICLLAWIVEYFYQFKESYIGCT